ncbi:MAG: PKD domain-containing protein [Methanomassiliicoccus sp.]|nr:PKD domain-containing protein [Methanomassiliicoccus sp.]
MALLLPGLVLLSNIPTSSAAAPDSINSIGRVTVSGPDILVDGKKPSHQFYGVVDTTALAFAIEAYIDGKTNVAGWTSVFNAPDTGNHIPVSPHDSADAFWNQYFAQMKYYGVNLVRIGAGDTWGTEHQYDAWKNHQEEYFDLLHTMAYYAQANGVWLCFVLAGAQEYPTYDYYGSGSVFDPSSTAFANYIDYCKSNMVELEKENSIAMYDVFNEPDHNNVNSYYWHGDKVRFNTWENAVADATADVSSHPRTMGVAGFGNLFGMTQEDFNLSTGDTGFEILHRHYYGSNSDTANFALPEEWARAVDKPLLWGELANNGVYPLVRYTFGEKAIWSAGGQAITSMVLTGTSGYPYSSGVSSASVAEKPTNWKGDYAGSDSSVASSLQLDFTSSPSKKDKVGSLYEYNITTNAKGTIKMATDADFLIYDEDDSVVKGIAGEAGNYTVALTMDVNGQTVQQSYTLQIASDPEKGTAKITPVEVSSNAYDFAYTAELSDGNVSSVRWDFGDGTSSTELSPNHTFGDGQHLITLTLTSEKGTVLNTTYGLDINDNTTAPGAAPGQSIAGAVGYGTTNSVLMIVGLICASMIGLVGYYTMNRRGVYSRRHAEGLRLPDPRMVKDFVVTTLRLLKGMNYPDRKLIKELCLYLFNMVKARGFELVVSVKAQAFDAFKHVKETVAKHHWIRKK